MIATRYTYGKRIVYSNPRWCSVCCTQRATTRGKFDAHSKPDGQPCPNSGQSVKKAEAAG